MNSRKRSSKGMTYRDAGVDIDAGNELVRRIAPAAEATRRAESLAGVGGFAALTSLPAGYRDPVLVTGTDGVGTKLKLAIDHDRHDHIGQDLVAMCVNDVLVTGAEPLLFLDYYATAELDVDVAERVIKGIAEACKLAGCTLAGGETAEMPGFYARGDYDLAGFCVGVVERDRILDGTTLASGQSVIGLASSGPHSNGYSLIRRILDTKDIRVDARLLDQLIAPTRIYVNAVKTLVGQVDVHAMAHITGGGLVENLPRMLPPDSELCLALDLDSWNVPDIFAWLQQAASIDELEMLRTFNCGLGYVVVVDAKQAQAAVECLGDAGEVAWVVGSVVDRAAVERLSRPALIVDARHGVELRR